MTAAASSSSSSSSQRESFQLKQQSHQPEIPKRVKKLFAGLKKRVKPSDINALIKGRSLLHWACMDQRWRLIPRLIRLGASRQLQDIDRKRPLDHFFHPTTAAKYSDIALRFQPAGFDSNSLDFFDEHDIFPERTLNAFFASIKEGKTRTWWDRWLLDRPESLRTLVAQRLVLAGEGDPQLQICLGHCKRLGIDLQGADQIENACLLLQNNHTLLHLVGDGFGKGMYEFKGSSQVRLEANSSSSSCLYLIALLRRVCHIHAEKFTPETLATLKGVTAHLIKAFTFCCDWDEATTELMSCEGNDYSDEVWDFKREKVQTLVTKFMDTLSEHPVGEPLLVPIGWDVSVLPHKMLLQLQQGEDGSWSVAVFDTGAGLPFHPQQLDGAKVRFSPYIRFKDVPPGKIMDRTFWESMLEPLLAYIPVEGRPITSFSAQDIYVAVLGTHLGLYREDELSLATAVAPMTAQRTQTDSFRVLLSLLRIYLDSAQYKRLKNLLHLTALGQVTRVDRDSYRDFSTSVQIHGFALENLARQAIKLLKKGQVSALELRTSSLAIKELQERIDDLAPRPYELPERADFINFTLELPVTPLAGDSIFVSEGRSGDPFTYGPEQMGSYREVYDARVLMDRLTRGFTENLEKVDDAGYYSLSTLLDSILLEVPFPSEALEASIASLSMEEASGLVQLMGGLQGFNLNHLSRLVSLGIVHALSCRLDQLIRPDSESPLSSFPIDVYPLLGVRNQYARPLGCRDQEEKLDQLLRYFGHEETDALRQYQPSGERRGGRLFDYASWKLKGKHLRTPPPKGTADRALLSILYQELDAHPDAWVEIDPKNQTGAKEEAWRLHSLYFGDIYVAGYAHITALQQFFAATSHCIFPDDFQVKKAQGTEVLIPSDWYRNRRALAYYRYSWKGDIAHQALGYSRTDCFFYPLREEKALSHCPLMSHDEALVTARLPEDLQKLMSARSDRRVAIPRVIQYFENHLEELAKEAPRTFFYLTIFAHGDLRREIERSPETIRRLRALLTDKAFSQAIVSLDKGGKGKPRADAAAYVLGLCYLQAAFAGYMGDAKLLRSVQKQLRSWLLREPKHRPLALQGSDCYYALNKTLDATHQFTGTEDWDIDATEDILRSKACDQGIHHNPDGLYRSLDAPIKLCGNDRLALHREAIIASVQKAEDRDRVLNSQLKAAGILSPPCSWEGEFPFYKQVGTEITYEMNARTVEVYVDDEISNPTSRASLRRKIEACGVDSKDFLELCIGHPTRKVRSEKTKALVVSGFPGGKLLSFVRPKDYMQRAFIQLTIDGQHYVNYRDSRSIFLDDGWVWVSVADNPRSYLLTDEKLQAIATKDYDGQWRYVNGRQFEVLTTEPGPGIRYANGDLLLSRIENYAFSRDTEGRYRWKEDPQFYLCERQQVRAFDKYPLGVVLEDSSGSRRFVMGANKGRLFLDLDEESRAVASNSLTACDLVALAVRCYDFRLASHYLDSLSLFPRLDIKVFKRIKSWLQDPDEVSSMMRDGHPEALPILLRACYLALRAAKIQPAPKQDDYYVENWIYHPDAVRGSGVRNASNLFWSRIAGLLCKYFDSISNIPLELHLEETLGLERFCDWIEECLLATPSQPPLLIYSYLKLKQLDFSTESSGPYLPPPKIETSRRGVYPSTFPKEKPTDYVFPRLRDRYHLKTSIRWLLELAKSESPESKRYVQDLIMHSYYDRNDARFVPIVLDIALHPEKDPEGAKNFLGKFQACLDSGKELSRQDTSELHAIAHKWQLTTPSWSSTLPTLDPALLTQAERFDEHAKTLTPLPALPTAPAAAAAAVEFPWMEEDIFYESLAATCFQGAATASSSAAAAVVAAPEGLKGLRQRRFGELNDDYREGQLQNCEPQYSSSPAAANTLVEKLSARKTAKVAEQAELKQAVLDLAQLLPEDPLESDLEGLARRGKQRRLLNLNDCIHLYLRGGAEALIQRNPQLSVADAHRLLQKVAEYLQVSCEIWRIEDAQQAALAYRDNKDPRLEAGLCKRMRESLTARRIYNPIERPEFLVFEYFGSELLQKNVRLRPDQIVALEQMLKKTDGHFDDILIQRIMGSGKTFVFGSLMALMKADGYHLSLHVPPASLFEVNATEMMQRSKSFYGQTGRVIRFSRSSEYFNMDCLRGIRKTLHEAIIHREFILISAESLQSLRNRYYEACEDIKDLMKEKGARLQQVIKVLKCYVGSEKLAVILSEIKAGEKKLLTIIKEKLGASNVPDILQAIGKDPVERLKDMRDELGAILQLLRDRAVATLDEVDSTLLTNLEHNFPVGHRFPLKPRLLDLIKQLYTQISADRRAIHMVGLARKKEISISSEEYEGLKALLAEQMLQYCSRKPLWQRAMHWDSYSPSERAELMAELHAYLTSPDADLPKVLETLRDAPEEDSRDFAEGMILLHQELCFWMVDDWKMNLDEHFGGSEADPDYELARPYLANNTPNERSEFADRWTLCRRSIRLYLRHGINQKQLLEWILAFRKRAELQAQRVGHECTPMETKAAAKFHDITGVELYSFSIGDQDAMEAIQATLADGSPKSQRATMSYLRKCVLARIRVPGKQVHANAQNLASLFKTLQGYSGTMENRDTLPDRCRIQLDRGTNGRTIDLLRRRNDVVKISEVEGSLLEEILATHPRAEKVRAIIDVGAHYKGIKNRKVVDSILAFYNARRKDPRFAQVQGVLYFEEKTNTLKFIHKDRPTEVVSIPKSDPATIAHITQCRPDQIFTYYDQRRGTGTDIKQAVDAEALVTFSRKTPLRDLLQGVRRMRELDYNQHVEFIVCAETTKLILKRLGLPEDTLLNIHHLIAFAELNEADRQIRDNLQSCFQKIQNVAQEMATEKLFAAEDSTPIFEAISELFIRSLLQDLFEEYGRKPVTHPTADFLQQVIHGFIDKLEPILGAKELERASHQMHGHLMTMLEKHALPATVTSSQLLSALLETTVLQQQEQEEEEEQEQEQERQIQDGDKKLAILPETPWPEDAILHPNFPHVGLVTKPEGATPRVNPRVATLCYKLAEKEQLQEFAAIFDADVQLSSNFNIAPDTAKELPEDLLSGLELEDGSRAIGRIDSETRSAIRALFPGEFDAELIGDHVKESNHILAVRQGDEWRMQLLTLAEAGEFRRQIQRSTPEELRSLHRGVYLMDRNGRILDSVDDSWDPRWLADPHSNLVQSLIQIMALAGDVRQLSHPQWKTAVQAWLGRCGLKVKQYFERHVASRASHAEEYAGSPLKEWLKQPAGSSTS